MMSRTVLSALFLLIFSLSEIRAADKLIRDKEVGRLYFQNFMGHLHQESKDTSSSLTALQCAHPVVVIERKGVDVAPGWLLVKVGEDVGYIRSRFLDSQRPSCFQEKYAEFYRRLNLDVSDLYFWGRLSDHFIEGESQSK